MSRRERAKGAGSSEAMVRVDGLLAAGDHRAARATAAALAADEAAPEADRQSARRVLASLRPDPAVAVVGWGALAFALGLAAWTVLGGAPR